MKLTLLLMVLAILFMLFSATGCAPADKTQESRDNDYEASYSREACFKAGGDEFQMYRYTGSGTCVWRKK